MARLERNSTAANLTGDAMMYGNVAGMFTSSTKGMKEMSSEAEKTAVSVAKTGTETRLAAEGAVMLGANAASAAKGVGSVRSSVSPVKSALSGLKTVASDAGTVLMGAFGGPAGIALTAGLTVVGTAFSAYSQHVSKGKAEVESFNEAAKATPNALSDQASSLEGLKNRLDNFGSTVKNNLNTSRDFLDKFKFGEVSAEDFNSVSDALKRIGESETAASKATSGSNAEFDKYIKNLQRIEDAGSSWSTNSATGDMVHNLSAQGKAAQVAREGLQKLRKEQTDALQEQATAAGKSANYVQTLLNEGQGYQEIADGLLSTTEKKERLATVTSSLASQIESQRNANIQAAAAESSYAKTLQQVGDAVKTVNDLHSQGQRVWDAQKKNFDYTTEAGRTAADSLTALASSSNDYLNAMIKQGKSQKEVLAKQKELSSNFNAQASAAGLDAAAVDGLNSSLLMTPKEVKTQISVQTLNAQMQLANVVEQIDYLFPDGNRKQIKEMILNSIWSGKTDAEDLSNLISKLADHKHTVVLDADGRPVAVAVDDVTQALLKVPELKKVYLQAITEGKSDADALKETIESVPALKDAYVTVKAQGKTDLDALTDAIMQVPKLKEAYLNATTQGKDQVDALSIALSLIPQETLAQVSAEVTGKTDADSLNQAIRNIPQLWNAYQNAIQSGKGGADALRDAIKSIPLAWDAYEKATAEGKPEVDALADSIRALQSRTVTVTTQFVTTGSNQGEHIGYGTIPKATGGRIYGPGTGTSDSIPAWLSNGEHVIRAAAVNKLDRTVGPNFLNVLNATGDLDKAVSQARTSYARSAVDMSRTAYASGGRVEKMMSNAIEVNVQVPDSSRELVSAVNDLRREVADFRDGIGGEISRNSSPWPSKRDFVRDVLEASRGR